MRNRQKQIIFLGQVSFFIVVEARTEMGRGENCGAGVSRRLSAGRQELLEIVQTLT